MKLAMFFLVVVLCSMPAVVYAADDIPSLVSGLNSSDMSARFAAAAEIRNQRDALVKGLISIVENKNSDVAAYGPLHMAVVLLGDLRVAEAVPVLTKRLMYRPQGGIITEQLPEEAHYVCAWGLVKIGSPAIDAMMNVARSADNEQEWKLAAWVIQRIEGKDQAVHRVDSLIKTEPQEKERLLKVKDYIDKYKLMNSYPKKG